MIDQDLLQILRCPVTRGELAVAGPELLAALNDAIASGAVRNRAGETIEESLDAALVVTGESLCYRIQNGIPCLIGDEAMPFEQSSETTAQD